jgi:threonine/homoserine/homoserine lactone efflux protein
MPEFSTLAVFVVSVVALLLVPGPVVLYTVARSLEQGWRAGLLSTVGVELGDFAHVVAATLGLSALLASSATAFAIVKYAGAAYLVYLGVRAIMDRSTELGLESARPMPLRRVFSQGFVVAVLNPKTSLFFLAFLPQFVDETRGSVSSQIMLLGVIFVALGVVTNAMYALLAGGAGGWLRRHPQLLSRQRYFTGSVYIGLGLTTALASSPDRR